MGYQILEKYIYLNSRYEFIQLLEDIAPAPHGRFERIDMFNTVTDVYEQYVDQHFPFCEERLAIFHGYTAQSAISLRF